MASTAGLVEEAPAAIESPETQPLLSRSNDVIQQEKPILLNLVTGTASIAQLGIWIFTILIWCKILSQPIILFTAHPLLAISGLLLQIQGILILQPTTTASEKQKGTRFHYIIQLISTLLFLSAFIVIEVNKGTHPHFDSAHGVLGLLTIIFIVSQSLFGVVQYFLPRSVLGSVENGKKLYKYHRWSGYVALLVLEIPAAIWGATQTGYSINLLHIPLWAVVIPGLAVVLGVGARLKIYKLGLGND
ncbi:hypothetical protein N7456_008923 [Penicillium angulare]|uniref:Cytochrome b561 domain-containing protein n=1 Tax=Penicillium angulare TaxID=116970 RepID=A0A9W9K5M4_9EURO|nr:hypothetical protein N7456_008923 [Penicillium angulare]